MALRWESKRPAEVRTYQINWESFLGTDTIDTYTLTATGITIDSHSKDLDEKGITAKLSGGTTGTLARLTNTIVTAAEETEAETIVLFVSNYAEPVSLELAKAQCRVTDDSEDALICTYVRAAREWVENYTGHILLRRPVTQTFTGFSDNLELHYRPIVETIGIDYIDAGDVAQEILPADLLTMSYPYRIRPVDAWPTILPYSQITANYVAGYDEGEAPSALIPPMLLLIEAMHSNRGQVPEETRRAVEWQCDQFRSPVV